MKLLACDYDVWTARVVNADAGDQLVPVFVCGNPQLGQEWSIVDDTQTMGAAIDRLIAVLNELFVFDEAFFSLIFTAMIVSWITGHYVGRMMQVWRKGM